MQLWPRRAVLTSLLRLALFSALLLRPAIASAQNDWPMFGHDDGSTRFSPLNQINTENVTQLQQAWTYHLSRSTPASNTAGPVGHGGGRRYSEATPIAANGLLYLPTPYGTVVALNPDKGTEVWSYKLTTGRPSTRGVAYWPGDKTTTPSILFGTSDGHLISLDADTGKPQLGFGETGIINLRTPDVMNGHPDARYDMTSPPILYKNLIITGAQVQETPELGTSGDTRAWDVHTGKLVFTRIDQILRNSESISTSETWSK